MCTHTHKQTRAQTHAFVPTDTRKQRILMETPMTAISRDSAPSGRTDDGRRRTSTCSHQPLPFLRWLSKRKLSLWLIPNGRRCRRGRVVHFTERQKQCRKQRQREREKERRFLGEVRSQRLHFRFLSRGDFVSPLSWRRLSPRGPFFGTETAGLKRQKTLAQVRTTHRPSSPPSPFSFLPSKKRENTLSDHSEKENEKKFKSVTALR